MKYSKLVQSQMFAFLVHHQLQKCPSRTMVSAFGTLANTNAILPPPSLSSSTTNARSSTSWRLHATDSTNPSGGRTSAATTDADLLAKTSSSPSSKKSKPSKKKRLDTNPPKGTRDFYPPDLRLRTWLFSHFRATAESFSFSEYDAPVLESTSLYTRKAGEEVTEQLYNFEDKGGRDVSLRPEMTPSLARMVMAKKGGLPMPIKYFSIPQCWRYERMTRGRRREHYQWNMDVWGVEGVQAEAELLGAMVEFFRRVGLGSEDVGIKVNSRLVIGEVLEELGIPEEKFASVCVLVDKLEKVPIEAVQTDLEALGLTTTTITQLLTVLTPSATLADLTTTLGPESPAVRELTQLFTLAESYGISDWLTLDASVVRGLAYYTGIVFEAFDRRGELRAIAGGGRYDRLLETFGGDPTPAVGFGFGDAVIVELLKERGILPTFDGIGVDAVVFAMSEELYGAAVDVACTLRKEGKSVDVVLEKKKTKWVFKHADRIRAGSVVIVAPDEYENGELSIKDMETGEQSSVKIEDMAEWANKTD